MLERKATPPTLEKWVECVKSAAEYVQNREGPRVPSPQPGGGGGGRLFRRFSSAAVPWVERERRPEMRSRCNPRAANLTHGFTVITLFWG